MAYCIAGPMRGLPNSNLDAFAEARENLRSRGYEVICPVETSFQIYGEDVQATDTNYSKAMEQCFRSVLECEGVIVLPGWGRSEGTKAELLLATTLGKPVYAYYKYRPQVLEELPNVHITTRAEVLS